MYECAISINQNKKKFKKQQKKTIFNTRVSWRETELLLQTKKERKKEKKKNEIFHKFPPKIFAVFKYILIDR